MAYVGVDINYGSIASQTAISGGSTTPIATLDYSVPTSSSIMVTLDGVTQVPGVDFNVTSGTNLTFTSSVPSGVVVCVYFLGRSVDIGTPGSGTVDSSAIVAGAVDDSHISGMAASKLSGTIATARLGSGTASSSTFLRGDQTYAEAGGGKVLQVVTGTLATAYSRSNLTATWVSVGLNASITPSATSSKILVIANIYATPAAGASSASQNHVSLGLFRDSTHIGASRQVPLLTNRHTSECGIVYEDSPSSTSAITYDIRGSDIDNASNSYLSVNEFGQSTQQTATSSIVLMEISV